MIPQRPTMWAAADWAIPGLIVVSILQPYFNSFLKEAGKDHYIQVKNFLNNVLSKAKTMNVKKITSEGIVNKSDESNSQSRAISIFLETKEGTRIKLLYDDNLDLETWQCLTHDFLKLIEMHYETPTQNILSEYLSTHAADKTIYAIIDPVTKKWNFMKATTWNSD